MSGGSMAETNTNRGSTGTSVSDPGLPDTQNSCIVVISLPVGFTILLQPPLTFNQEAKAKWFYLIGWMSLLTSQVITVYCIQLMLNVSAVYNWPSIANIGHLRKNPKSYLLHQVIQILTLAHKSNTLKLRNMHFCSLSFVMQDAFL